MAREGREAQRSREQAERLAEQARQMWDNATPREREELMRMAREMARDGEGPTPRGDALGARAEARGRPGPGERGEAGELGESPEDGQIGAGRAGGDDARGREGGDGLSPIRRGEPSADGPSRVVTLEQSVSPGGTGVGAGDWVVADWLGRGGAAGGPGSGVDAAGASRVLSEAARSAQQAVDDRVIPGRYDRVIRDFFRRAQRELGLPEVTPAPTSAPAPAPAPASAPAAAPAP